MKKTDIAKHMATLTVPPGFTLKRVEEPRTTALSGGDTVAVEYILESDDARLVFGERGDGHTHMKTDKGSWRCFDRTGIEDSFYHLPLYEGDKREPLDAIVAEQFARIAKAREYYKTAISVPTIPFTVSPERLATLKAQLAKQGGSITFTPSGFGTGYRVSRRPPPWGKRAKPELETFFGVSPLYLETMDCD